MKVNLGLHDNTSLMVVRESITEYIVKRFEKLEADFEASRELNQTTETSDPDIQGRGSKISQIKARSYSTVVKASRSRRYRQQTAQSSSNRDQAPAKTKVTKGKGHGGWKGKRRATNQSSTTETSEDDGDSDDTTWTPHSVKKCKKAPSRKGAAVKGPTELLKTIRKLQAGNPNDKEEELNMENPPIANNEEDSNMEAELDDAQGISEKADQAAVPLSKTGMPCRIARSIEDSHETSTALKPTAPSAATALSHSSEMQKGKVTSSKTKTPQMRTRMADEPSNQPVVTPKKVSAASRKESQMQPSKTPSKASAKTSVQTKSPKKDADKPLAGAEPSSETPRKRTRSQTNTSSDHKSDTSPEVSPKKKLRGSDAMNPTKKDDLSKITAELQSSRSPRKSTRDKTKNTHETSLKKPNSAADAEVSTVMDSEGEAYPKCNTDTTSGEKAKEFSGDNIGAGFSGSGGQHASSSTGHRSSSRGQGPSQVEAEQSSYPSPRGLRSAAVRRRGSRSARGQGLKPGDQRLPLKEQGDLPQGLMRSPRPNTTLKMRGGGIGARTRGARKNVSK